MLLHEKRRDLQPKSPTMKTTKSAEKLVYAYFNGKPLREREKHDFENDYFLWDADEPAQDE